MLTHEETLSLIGRARAGDDTAKEVLVTSNMPLIKSIVKHFRGRNIEYDDLIQLGSMGLIKAINNFDTGYDVKFSTYAVPMISGEIKRFIRDDGAIKISRAIKTLSGKIAQFVEAYKGEHSVDPSVEQIAAQFQIPREDVIYAMDSSKYLVSLQEKGEDENGRELIDRIPSAERDDDLIDKILLKSEIEKLSERERLVVVLRFYRDKTQSEIAQMLGVSQVQVSRIESKLLEKMRAGLVIK